MRISIETEINADLSAVWDAWVTPEDITCWHFALDEWCCPKAALDLKAGGNFNYRMEAMDGSAGFDFKGQFMKINPHKSIYYTLGDERVVELHFIKTNNGVKVVETFEAEDENTAEQQKQGWLSIFNNFKKHVENKTTQ